MERTHCGLAGLRRELEANPRGTLRYPGDEEDRATSLAATLDLSYRALPEDARATLPLLALFPAGLTREGAWAILGEAGKTALETLLQYGMAEWRDEGGYGRFGLPEPARRYAEALQEPGALDRYAPAALAFFHEFVAMADEMLTNGRDLRGTLLTLEQPNLRRFLDWGCQHEQRDDAKSLSARATALLGNYWTLTAAKQHPETSARLERALKAARRNNDQFGEANVLQAIGDVQQFRDDRDAALASYEQALGLFRAVGDRLGEANVLGSQGQLALISDNQFEADRLLEEAIAIYRAIGDRYSIAMSIGNYGWALRRVGQPERAHPYNLRAAELYSAMGLDDYAARHRRAAEGQPSSPDIADVLRQFEPLLQGIAAAARGDAAQRAEIEALLPQLEANGWRIGAAARDLGWAARLCGVDRGPGRDGRAAGAAHSGAAGAAGCGLTNSN